MDIEIKTKVCFRCEVNKPLTDYYKHKKMGDGHLNKCKSCTKSDAIKNHEKKSLSPEWVEKERARSREKYHRLNYKESQKEWNKKRPWSSSGVYKNLSHKFKTDKGTELHHWSYKDSNLEDVFVMETKQHRMSHKYLNIDIENMCFRDLENNLLITKDSHFKYLQSLGIKFISYKATKTKSTN